MDKIKLSKEEYENAVDEIRKFFECERDEDIGNLQGQIMMDFILEKIGPSIYNKAIDDMQKYMTEKIDDMYGYMIP
ncbi:DUF2164 domain-containing protein [Clostridium oceanicum]|uniref:DUF2164 domain-containing protein n=1 Tax=Clostridium oceanicum TaxID=1543 RepID=A0ABP3UU46_9CLOT